jgi:hypothetical protein
VFFTIESALLRSKEPEWFNLYSNSKVIFIFLSAVACLMIFLGRRKIPLPNRWQLIWNHWASHHLLIFFITASLSSIFLAREGVVVGEDIGGQVKSALQWIEGQVPSPNFLLSPDPNDLSANSMNWSLRPPGAAIIPVPGLLLGLSLGLSIKIALFFFAVAGGLGWLFLIKRFGICQHTLLLVSILLGLMVGNYTSQVSSANIILFALVPWFLVWLISLSLTLENGGFKSKNLLKVGFFLFCLGIFPWVKLSGIIAAGTIGSALLIFILFMVRNKLKTALVLVLLGILFWVPFAGLEGLNHFLLGKTADQGYKQFVTSSESPLTGEHWMASTQSSWLIWSLAAAPGYALPTKSIAVGIRDLGKQFQSFREWMYEKEINDHVFLAGSLSLLLTLLLIFEIKSAFSMFNLYFKIMIICFCTLPFIGLSILSNRFQWNYLMFHSHTFEYWLVFIVPTLTILSKAKYVSLRTLCLSGILLAFPLWKNAQSLTSQFLSSNNSIISNTEKERGLSSSRFSNAIEYIENDSVNDLDVIYFLPGGDMGDLILRTKMRTLATHFAGGNLPQLSHFKTSKELNIYLAYDEELSEIPEFIEAISEKFKNSLSEKTILKDGIFVRKIKLFPTPSVS